MTTANDGRCLLRACGIAVVVACVWRVRGRQIACVVGASHIQVLRSRRRPLNEFRRAPLTNSDAPYFGLPAPVTAATMATAVDRKSVATEAFATGDAQRSRDVHDTTAVSTAKEQHGGLGSDYVKVGARANRLGLDRETDLGSCGVVRHATTARSCGTAYRRPSAAWRLSSAALAAFAPLHGATREAAVLARGRHDPRGRGVVRRRNSRQCR